MVVSRGPDTPIADSFDRYLQDIGKGRSGKSGHYRRNSERELDHFEAWAAGEKGPNDWKGIVSDASARLPAFGDLDAQVFREYARYLTGDRGLKQNTVQTYYAYLSAWTGWCVTEGYLDTHYAKRASAKAPLPDDDGRKPGDQQAWTPDQRHALTEYITERAESAVEEYDAHADGNLSTDQDDARYTTLKATRDEALVYLIAYTAVRVGELLRDPDDPRRRGVRWEEVDLDDGSMNVYRKKQQWDSASLPRPVILPLRRYKRVLNPPSERWPVFPTLHYNSLREQVQQELADRGFSEREIAEHREEYIDDLFLALDEDIRPPSITTDGARSVLERVTTDAGIDVDHPRHDYLAPHGGRRGMGEVLVRAFGYTVAARYLDNSEEMVRKRYSHIEAGELGDVAAEAIEEVDGKAL